VAPTGRAAVPKLTNPRVTRFTFRPTLTSKLVFPPPLLERNPSIEALESKVLVVGVGVGVGVGVDVGVGVNAPVGFGVTVGVRIIVGMISDSAVASSAGTSVRTADSPTCGAEVFFKPSQKEPPPTAKKATTNNKVKTAFFQFVGNFDGAGVGFCSSRSSAISSIYAAAAYIKPYGKSIV